MYNKKCSKRKSTKESKELVTIKKWLFGFKNCFKILGMVDETYCLLLLK